MRFPERSTPIGQKINAYLTNVAELNDKTLHELFCQNRYNHNCISILTHQMGIQRHYHGPP